MQNPIGIFDSGIGGLNVMAELAKVLPQESFEYYADSGNCPYGDKSPQEIIDRCEEITEFLLQKGCKVIVIACNTATAAAIHYLRAKHPKTPFVGMEPAVKPAAQNTKTGHIGVLSTQGTSTGRHFKETCEKHAKGVQVHVEVARGWAEIVEAGTQHTPAALSQIQQYVEPLLKKNVDHLILGCTHYPFLKEQIAQIAGPKVTIVDPAPAVARHTAQILQKHNLQSPQQNPSYNFYTSGDPTLLQKFAKNFPYPETNHPHGQVYKFDTKSPFVENANK